MMELLAGTAPAAPWSFESTDLAAMNAPYWSQRHYWRERVAELVPHVAHYPRQHVIAARALSALFARNQMVSDANDGVGLWELEGSQGELLAAVRRCRNPLDVQAACDAMELSNVGAKVRRRTAVAPDAMEGARHAVTRKRSNSGRTATTVIRPGVAMVQGAANTTAPHIVRRGTWHAVPYRYRAMARRSGRTLRRVWKMAPFEGVPGRDSLTGAMMAHLLEHAPRRGNGANALYVSAVTANGYNIASVSDVRQWLEVTPPLPEIDPRDACAVHRADMSGQTGILELTERLGELSTGARHTTRLKLRRPRARKSEITLGLAHVTVNDNGRKVIRWNDPDAITSADTGRKRHTPTVTAPASAMVAPAAFPTRERVTYLPHANCQHDYRAPAPTAPVIWQDNRGEIDRMHTASGAIWSGHRYTYRGKLARQTVNRGALARRTIGNVTTAPATLEGWQELAESLEQGERVTGTYPTGATWTLNRGQRFSGNVTNANGDTVRFSSLRTTNAAARRLYNLTT